VVELIAVFLFVAGKWLHPVVRLLFLAVSGFPGNWLPYVITDALVTITLRNVNTILQ
jgi:hypothetical protein